jgi:general secretion pathway protein E
VQASLTGHLVLSTLHTNSAVGAMTRLQDMGVEPFLLSSSLVGVVAQRLVRLLCGHCKAPKTASDTECALFKIDKILPPIIFTPVGCEHCHYTGYDKRVGIYELIVVDDTLRVMIHDQVGEPELRAYCQQHYHDLRHEGLQRVIAGDTSVEEVLRTTSEY